MNKKLLVVAVAGVMAMPLAANAGGKHKAYGAVHVSVNKLDDSGMSVDGSARKANKIGMKGSMDTNIADFKAIYQIEAGMVVGATNGFDQERDTWAGLSSKSMGTVRVGTMGTHWKQMSKATDALFTTSAEGRGLIGTQSSKLAGGAGAARGRATQLLRYDSPSISGAKVIAQYQMTSGENNMGVGVQYKAGNYLAFFDYMDLKSAGDKTAMKVGGKAKFGPASVALQYEIDDNGSVETTTGGENQLHVQGTYGMGATTFILTVGNNSENTGYAVAVSQKVAKKASAYVAYGADGSGDDDSTAISVGMKVAFGS
jgi:predicted porin